MTIVKEKIVAGDTVEIMWANSQSNHDAWIAMLYALTTSYNFWTSSKRSIQQSLPPNLQYFSRLE